MVKPGDMISFMTSDVLWRNTDPRDGHAVCSITNDDMFLVIATLVLHRRDPPWALLISVGTNKFGWAMPQSNDVVIHGQTR